MKKLSFLILACCMTIAAFGQKVADVKGETFGEAIHAKKYISMNDLVADLDSKDTVNATVMATVNEVCQAKGCWMTLDNTGGKEMMVRFKDYGFFVPKDIGGREVIIEGQAYSTVVPVEELRHYAEDAGKSKEEIEKITEPETKLAFLASGVIVLSD